jgi:VWFA-related protein
MAGDLETKERVALRWRQLLVLTLASSLTAASQSAPAASDSVSTLKVNVRLVPVHIVVRDAQGRAVGNLSKEDFQLFDQGKLQVITQFSVEHAGAQAALMPARPGSTTGQSTPIGRYTAYLFDDLHLDRNNLVQARKAADGQLASLSATTERVAIFTTSGQKGIDFTADRAKLHETLFHLEPRGSAKVPGCPNMSPYLADLIANKGDAEALQFATNDALACGFDGNVKLSKAARQMASSAAREMAETGRVETSGSLRILKALIQAMSKAPGQRTIVVVSPGFSIAEDPSQVDIIDLAVLGDVTVSALDPGGIAPANDISGPSGGRFDPRSTAFEALGVFEEQAILEELADGTGGVFFHNNNDVNEGFKRVGATPEYSYVLAFSPQDVKLDGRFHKLKVTVNNGAKLTIQARKGYYTPKQKP